MWDATVSTPLPCVTYRFRRLGTEGGAAGLLSEACAVALQAVGDVT